MQRKPFIKLFVLLLSTLLLFGYSSPVLHAEAPIKKQLLEIRPYITLSRGGSYQLTPTLNQAYISADNLYFESSDPTIAKVDTTGLITAQKKGTAKVTISTKDNPGLQCSIRVYVGKRITRLKLNYNKKTIQINNYFMLKATTAPRKASLKKLSYKSSNPAIAKVSSKGKVTALGLGTVTITVTTMDGSNLSKSCTVKVVKDDTSTEDSFFFFKGDENKEREKLADSQNE